MRNIRINIGSRAVGQQKTFGYPHGERHKHFWIPAYECTVNGVRDNGQRVTEKFRVLRFGVHNPDGRPRVVGLADPQEHIIKAWIPTYSVHSAQSQENGAWQVYGNFLIHDGPDNEFEIFATIGCIEIMGPQGFVRFNDLIIALSGLSGLSSNRNDQLNQIARSGKLSIFYQAAPRPPLKEV